MGARKLLVLIACLFFAVLCGRCVIRGRVVPAPIVNIIRFEDGEFFILLNNIRPNIAYIENLYIGEGYERGYYEKDNSLTVDKIRDYHNHDKIDYVLLRTKSLSYSQFVKDGIFVITMTQESFPRTKVSVKAEFKEREVHVLLEEYEAWEYGSFPYRRRWVHFENTF